MSKNCKSKIEIDDTRGQRVQSIQARDEAYMMDFQTVGKHPQSRRVLAAQADDDAMRDAMRASDGLFFHPPNRSAFKHPGWRNTVAEAIGRTLVRTRGDAFVKIQNEQNRPKFWANGH